MKKSLSEVLNNSHKIVKIGTNNAGQFTIELGYVSKYTTTDTSGNFPVKYSPVSGDKIYIYPESGIPRFKLKEYCQKNNISLVRDANKSNARFLNIKHEVLNRIKKMSFYCIKRSRMAQFLNDNPGIFTPVQEGLMRTGLCVYDWYTSYKFADTTLKNPIDRNNSNETFSLDQLSDILYESMHYFNEETYIAFTDYLARTDIFSPEDLIEDLSSGLVMDKKLYEGISRLFDSEDTSNHVIAMESMANCDFQKSAVYLLALMKNYRSEIAESRVRNHVNFKALRNYFDWEMTHLTGDSIVVKLQKKGLATKENIDKLLPIVMSEIKVETKLTKFKVKNLEYTGQYDGEVFEDLPVEDKDEVDSVLLDHSNSQSDGDGEIPHAITV